MIARPCLGFPERFLGGASARGRNSLNSPLVRFGSKREHLWLLPSALALFLAGISFLSYPSHLHGQTVQGHLTDAQTGFAMSGANVALRDSAATVVARTESNYLGAFQITAPAPGQYSILVEAIGYRSAESGSFEVREGEATTIDLSLRPDPVQLDSIAVEAEAKRIIPHLERQGFYQRMDEGFGQFITPEDIERRNPRYFSDLLRDIPRLRVDRIGHLSWPPRCAEVTPHIWLDGIMVDWRAPLTQYVSIDEIQAIEVYVGAARVPLQYGGAEGQCVMLIWTKGWLEVPHS